MATGTRKKQNSQAGKDLAARARANAKTNEVKAKTNMSESDQIAFRRSLSRAGTTHDGRRDMYEVFGYSRTLIPQDFRFMYRRQDIANRIVRAYPQATWRDYPGIRDTRGNHSEKDKPGYSPFYEAVEKFFEEKNIMHYLERADRQASIGHYGLLFMGFRDGKDPREPLITTGGKMELLYLQPYAEESVTISQWETDPQSPRFGQPTFYTITTGGARTDGGYVKPVPSRSMQVHHSRVLHIAEFLEEDNVYGTPRLEAIYNRMVDLEKVVGGSAETFWLTADRGLLLSADKEAILTDEQQEEMKKQVAEYRDAWRKTLVGQGITADVLGSEDPDPEPNAEKLLDLISGAAGIPKRILMGSERGELSSAQDENNWAQRIQERRSNFAIPMILRPLINLLIKTKNIPEPQGLWWCEWVGDTSLGAEVESVVAVNRANALATYANAPAASMIVPEQEFREEFLGLPAETPYAEDHEDEEDALALPEGDLAIEGVNPDDFYRGDVVKGALPGAEATPGMAGGDVQATALNGAQVTALQGTLQAVADGQLPRDTAKQMILVAFPTVTEEQAEAMLTPLDNFEPKKEEPVLPFGAQPPGNDEEMPNDGPPDGPPDGAVDDEEALVDIKTNATPRPLYVRREVLNAKTILEWAARQGFKTLEPANKLHATIHMSKVPLDWMRVGGAWYTDQDDAGRLMIHAGGVRIVEELGDKGAVVLMFGSVELTTRHNQICQAGAEWPHESYQPHITFSYDKGDVDLDKVEPYTGAIALGPEKWSEA